MGEFGSLLLLLIVVMFLILLYKFSSKYRRIEEDIDEIKNKIDDLLKSQMKVAAEAEKLKESSPEEARTAVSLTPSVVEEVPLQNVSLKKEGSAEKKKQADILEDLTNRIPEEVYENPIEESFNEESLETNMRTPITSKKNVNYEKFIGENLFGKIGILIFVIGVGFFVKYAIDKDWINETMRTVLGFITGSALLAVAERLQKKYRTFSSLLAGGAFAVFYLTVAIAFHYYHLFSQTVAFIILVCVTIFMTVLSILYDRRELAVIALVGGFLAPFIVSSGEGSYIVLFTYLSILNVGMFVLSLYKKWGELPVISFGFTYLVMAVFLLTNFDLNMPLISGHLFAFVTLFYFIFLLPVLSILRMEGKKMSRILLWVIIVNNFIYLGFGTFFLHFMSMPFKATGLLSLFIAIVNLGLVIWLRKSKQDYKFLIYAMLGLVLTFVSITIPIQLEGNYITLFWASEMVLLLWLYIKSGIRVYEYGAIVLVVLTSLSYIMDLSLASHLPVGSTMFLNSPFATSLFFGLALCVFAILMERNRERFVEVRLLRYIPWNPLMLVASVTVLYYTFMEEFYRFLEGTVMEGVMLLFTSVTILVVSYAFRKRFPMNAYAILYSLGMAVCVGAYMICVWQNSWNDLTWCSILLFWLSLVCTVVNFIFVTRQYLLSIGQKSGFLIYLNILSMLLWITAVRSFLVQIGIEDFSAGFSVSMSIAGLVQMTLGMRLHQKLLRIISLYTFGIVLLKLGLSDLWAMSAIGKIIVFILLGLILLVLSFLYQKLKNVLFKDDQNEVE